MKETCVCCRVDCEGCLGVGSRVGGRCTLWSAVTGCPQSNYHHFLEVLSKLFLAIDFASYHKRWGWRIGLQEGVQRVCWNVASQPSWATPLTYFNNNANYYSIQILDVNERFEESYTLFVQLYSHRYFLFLITTYQLLKRMWAKTT